MLNVGKDIVPDINNQFGQNNGNNNNNNNDDADELQSLMQNNPSQIGNISGVIE